MADWVLHSWQQYEPTGSVPLRHRGGHVLGDLHVHTPSVLLRRDAPRHEDPGGLLFAALQVRMIQSHSETQLCSKKNQKSLEALQLCPGPDHRGPDGQSALQWCEQVIFARSIVVKVLCLGLTFLSSSTTTSGVDLCSLSLSLSFSTKGLVRALLW